MHGRLTNVASTGFSVALLAVALGCGPARSAAQTKLLQAADEAGASAIDGGGARISQLSGRALRGELSAGFIVMLDASACFAIVGRSDSSLTTMAFTVTAPSGSWVARTEEPARDPVLRFCAKISGPHRIAATFTGRGDYLIGVYGKKPPASASALAALGSSASAPVSAAPLTDSASASASSSPPSLACAAVGADAPFSRLVDGAHRGCRNDSECIAVKTDCSQLNCAGVSRQYKGRYAAPLDCRGYSGPMGNYDCDPQFGIEALKCVANCCVSVRTTN